MKKKGIRNLHILVATMKALGGVRMSKIESEKTVKELQELEGKK